MLASLHIFFVTDDHGESSEPTTAISHLDQAIPFSPTAAWGSAQSTIYSIRTPLLQTSIPGKLKVFRRYHNVLDKKRLVLH